MYNVDSMYKNKALPFDILQNSNLTYVSYHTTDFTAKELLKGFRSYLQKKVPLCQSKYHACKQPAAFKTIFF